LRAYRKLFGKKSIALVAPTGRAAKRLNETTNYPAQTIHRLLGYQLSGEFTFNEHNPLDCDVIVIDEASMIDVVLMSQLLKSLRNHVKMIIVGDVDQLPSVGPGNVLKDIITSGVVPIIKLDKVHRQGEGSSIVSLAHDINKQIISKDLLIKQKDRNFIICSNDTLLKNLKFIMENALDKAYTLEEIQVLAPMYKGNLGIDNINSYLQEWLNPKSGDIKEFKYLNKVFRTGDKVIQLVNRPDLNIMNGDIGFIKDIYDEESRDDDVRLTVDFDGNIVDLTENDLNDLSLAYCISIHKAQGSEFDIVIVLLSKSYYIMLRKNLLYTAVTRAKKSLILLGDPDAYKLAIQNDQEIMRQTTLIERLQMRFNRRIITIDDYKFIYKPIKKLSPYDFLE
ncbi:MAG: AAA family ATPase, partial [Bacilli bacterium]|nr:AAA family ATPase [Bacilli bacterium]